MDTPSSRSDFSWCQSDIKIAGCLHLESCTESGSLHLEQKEEKMFIYLSNAGNRLHFYCFRVCMVVCASMFVCVSVYTNVLKVLLFCFILGSETKTKALLLNRTHLLQKR